ncbi:A disintegrin and metalloproteinase with thrombospondin motifs 13-like isoform X2 [Acanthaster planci]|uniref:A disintegrin and metalloproteinase with thrombospondin motifs 13-like isoform X2 n=1 Tax=Acanthaster planci TaxID=133434 RepID=A0A8B7XGH4_ACAPL|nr:A disintegrin and metalloproteinase with thrombospondin motifs 13-like isoform X2 [Acanthaster planci]
MKLTWASAVVLVAVVLSARSSTSLPATSDGNDLTQEDIKSYFGEITTVSKNGDASYDIVDIWDQSSFSADKLPVRHAVPHRHQHDVHFKAFREDFHLRLHKNPWLVREGLRMETLDKNGTVVASEAVRRDCFYFGDVVSHNSSSVAVSKCDGLAGVIGYGRHDIFIKPLRSDHAEQYRRRRRDAVDPHIVYRRSATDGDPTAHFCSPPPPMKDPETGMTVDEEMVAALGGKLLPSSLQTGQKYMELMIMVDNEMRKHHDNNLQSYVTTLLNIVARRFVDPSLGANLRIHVVKFYVLQSDEVGTGSDGFSTEDAFTVTSDGYQLLNDFCQWQGTKNEVDDAHPEHWDNAILITRYNLIDPTDGSDSLLGRAPVGGTCRHYQQCSVNEDDGLGSALTIAHETGHTLNLNHDSTYGCPDGVNIMSGIRSAGAGALSWSMCSQTHVQEFLRNPVSNCLNDEPLELPVSVNELPGTIYSYADQCQLAFDSDRYTMPVNGQVDCSVLACQDRNGAWRSKGVPVMEGTDCGTDKWCLDGQCVQRMPLPDAVDGQWSTWGGQFGSAEFGPCSRSCGGGVRSRMRYCDNPPPSNGGRGCEGTNVEYIVCETQPCATSQDDFRDEQCMATNNTPLNGVTYNWVKGFIADQTGDELCDHRCLSEQRFWSKREPFQFIDGTRCWHDEKNDAGKLKLCVGGLCKSFGCDGRENSNAVFDVCGVCNGDGSSCSLVSDSFTGGTTTGFNHFLTLPVGSTRIEISNANSAYTYIALKIGNEYVLQGSGNYRPSTGRYSAGSSVVLYESGSSMEKLTIAGPTTQEIEVEAFLFLNPNVNYVGGVNVQPDVQYRYYAPSGSGSGPQESFRWVGTAFSPCTATCGGGMQTRSVTCYRTVNAREEAVQDALCPQPKPTERQTCNTDTCPFVMPARWETSEWFPCSVTCGQGTRTRMVRCIRDGVEAPGSPECDQASKPAEQETCNEGDCSPMVPSACNGVTAEPSGIFYNIGQDTDGASCSQIIAASPGKEVVLRIVKLVIDCDSESFKIKVGLSEQRYCGYITNRQITVGHNIVILEHKTSMVNGGYHISYSLADSATPPNPCDRVLTVASGRITSPNWPNPYGPNQMCTTTVVVKPGKKIRVTFQKFFLDSKEPFCGKDYVVITDNNARMDSPVFYCGTKSRFTFRSRSNMIAITFRSDSAQELKGFKAALRQIN